MRPVKCPYVRCRDKDDAARPERAKLAHRHPATHTVTCDYDATCIDTGSFALPGSGDDEDSVGILGSGKTKFRTSRATAVKNTAFHRRAAPPGQIKFFAFPRESGKLPMSDAGRDRMPGR
jgi:hypothetical protein